MGMASASWGSWSIFTALWKNWHWRRPSSCTGNWQRTGKFKGRRCVWYFIYWRQCTWNPDIYVSDPWKCSSAQGQRRRCKNGRLGCCFGSRTAWQTTRCVLEPQHIDYLLHNLISRKRGQRSRTVWFSIPIRPDWTLNQSTKKTISWPRIWPRSKYVNAPFIKHHSSNIAARTCSSLVVLATLVFSFFC